jgi:hypothetical protein
MRPLCDLADCVSAIQRRLQTIDLYVAQKLATSMKGETAQ